MSTGDERRALGLVELDGAPGPAKTLSPAAADALTRRIVARALASRPLDPVRPTRRARWLMAAAVLGLASAAGAAASLVGRKPSTREPVPHGIVVPTVRERAPRVPRAARQPAGTFQQPELAPPGKSALAPALPDSRAAVAAPSAADQLRDANRLRAQGLWQEAERAYARVARSRPVRSESGVAALAAASLRLEHLGDPAGALRLYESVVRQGVLVEESLLGIARCHRALGDTTREIQTLKSLIARRPQPVIRDEAQRRLSALGESSGLP
jgi:hypothetical protein